MSVQFQYGGLPPAMARKMDTLGMPSQPSVPANPSLPQMPTPQGVQLPQVPQMQQRGLPDIQQYMPQNTPMAQNPYMPTAANQYMPMNMQDQNSTVFNSIMQQMNQSGQARRQAPLGNNMGMGLQDVDNPGGGGKASSHKGLGSLSAKYESNGDPGTIANTKGDLGGASYGTYQLTTTSGHAKNFANSYGGALKGLKPGTAAFNNAWKAEAKKNPKAFANAQHKYIENNHYKPAASNIKKKTGFDVSKYPKAVQDAVWSIGVQHGAGGAANIFRNAGVKNGMGAEQVLRAVYNERMKVHIYFKSSPKNIQDSVRNRFQSELSQALNML